jgi:hypothetical protein
MSESSFRAAPFTPQVQDGEGKAAISPPRPAPTAADIDAAWRDYCVIEVMIRNRNVDEFVREKEREVEGLWTLIKSIASQTDPAWAQQLAKDAVTEREG